MVCDEIKYVRHRRVRVKNCVKLRNQPVVWHKILMVEDGILVAFVKVGRSEDVEWSR
jgi:hypothetical protein